LSQERGGVASGFELKDQFSRLESFPSLEPELPSLLSGNGELDFVDLWLLDALDFAWKAPVIQIHLLPTIKSSDLPMLMSFRFPGLFPTGSAKALARSRSYSAGPIVSSIGKLPTLNYGYLSILSDNSLTALILEFFESF